MYVYYISNSWNKRNETKTYFLKLPLYQSIHILYVCASVCAGMCMRTRPCVSSVSITGVLNSISCHFRYNRHGIFKVSTEHKSLALIQHSGRRQPIISECLIISTTPLWLVFNSLLLVSEHKIPLYEMATPDWFAIANAHMTVYVYGVCTISYACR